MYPHSIPSINQIILSIIIQSSRVSSGGFGSDRRCLLSIEAPVNYLLILMPTKKRLKVCYIIVKMNFEEF